MRYKNVPAPKNIPAATVGGRAWHDIVADIDRELGIEVYDYELEDYRPCNVIDGQCTVVEQGCEPVRDDWHYIGAGWSVGG